MENSQNPGAHLADQVNLVVYVEQYLKLLSTDTPRFLVLSDDTRKSPDGRAYGSFRVSFFQSGSHKT